MYERQMQMLRNQLMSPSTPSNPYLPVFPDPFKMTPTGTSNSNMHPKYQQWATERWEKTYIPGSLYQGVKLGTGPGLGIQCWLWGSLCTSKSRVQVMMDPPSLWNPWAESTEVQNREYQWLHKMVTCHRKNFKNKTGPHIQGLSLNCRTTESSPPCVFVPNRSILLSSIVRLVIICH